MTEQENIILTKAISTYGKDAQMDMAIEEMSELTKEILKLRRAERADKDTKAEIEHLKEEMADVQIMLDQMYLIFGVPTEHREYKINRLKERLGLNINGWKI